MRKLLFFGLLIGGLGFGLVVQARLADAGPLRPDGAPAPSSVTLNQLGETLERIEASKFKPAELPNTIDIRQAGAVLLYVEGETVGAIEGEVASPGREGAINVLSFSHSVVSPRDAASGLPTGKRQHKPISITKAIDKSTPLLMQSLVNNENLTSVELKFYRQGDTGEIEQYYTITLENASIVAIESEIPNFETVAFYYQHITWTYEDEGITAEDDWESAV